MSEPIAEVRRLCETPWSAVNVITNAEIALRAPALLHEIDRLAALAPVQPVTDEATDPRCQRAGCGDVHSMHPTPTCAVYRGLAPTRGAR